MEHRRSRRLPDRPLVFIVDGHEDTREMYAIGLSAQGFETVTMDDVADAYTQAWKLHPNIVVTELAMPATDRWELIRRLKADPRTRDIPVVVLTSDGRQALREAASQEGCAAFFVKPELPYTLAINLRRILEQPAPPAMASDRTPAIDRRE